MNKVANLQDRFYESRRPQWSDGNEVFARLVHGLLFAGIRVLNLGAGGGLGAVDLRAPDHTIVGIDPDPVIAGNRGLTHRSQGLAEALPFRNQTFDLVFMDWVVEHLAYPVDTAREIFRVLRPGGYFAFRTGNLLHYSYSISRFTPQSFHDAIVRLVGAQEEIHTFPTYYRMNTVGAVRRTMDAVGLHEDLIVLNEPNPAYLGMSSATYLAGVAYERTVNRFGFLRSLRANILGRFRKPMS